MAAKYVHSKTGYDKIQILYRTIKTYIEGFKSCVSLKDLEILEQKIAVAET